MSRTRLVCTGCDEECEVYWYQQRTTGRSMKQ